MVHRSPAPPSPAPARERHVAWTLGLVAAAVLVVWGLLAWRERAAGPAPDSNEAVAARVLAEYSRGLPKPFGPGVTVVAAALEGRDVVMTLSVDKPGIAESLADPATRQRVILAEHAELLPLCEQREALHLLARGYTISRRFVAPDGAPYFTATLTGEHCLRARRLRRDAGETR